MTAATATMTQQQTTQGHPQERFFRHFQLEVTALQDQIQRLDDHGVSGGEQADAIEHCQGRIARLSNEVKDASSYLPAYDQRTYSEAIKALLDKLQKTRSSLAPRQKFSFKSGYIKKNASAISLNDAAELASQQRQRVGGHKASAESSFAPTPAELQSPAPEMVDDEATGNDPVNKSLREILQSGNAIRKPSFSQATSISLSSHNGLHIILPSSASRATTSGALSNLRNCVVDMSVPTASGRPFAGLTLKNVSNSLIVCGHVNGAAHITGVSDCVVVVACRQFRMHESKNVDVYLQCGSRPIIEACEGVRFAPFPATYATEADSQVRNQYDQVDDFKWLKAEPSPNWSVLDAQQRIADETWRDIVPGGPGFGPEDILKAVGVSRA
ncbi:hypothetical protein H2203_007581 [Taxawa tesnikishii (nom. ined.)]|nr:hypothetical protein H2203_007581 [Dothideales sp. JES 119]